MSRSTGQAVTDDETRAPWGRGGASGGWNREESGHCCLSNLGVNLLRLYAVVDRAGRDRTFVDLGVDHGVSSLALGLDAIERGNLVYGVDLSFANLGYDLRAHPNHRRIRGDSVTVGKHWDRGDVDLVFVDTLHVEPQVLSELYHWYPRVRPGGYVIVHDTAWPEGRHDLAWHPRASAADPAWPTPDRAVAAFFGLERQFGDGKFDGFHHVDDDLEVTHHAESWGMTIIRVKRRRDLRSNITDWSEVFRQRARVLRSVMSEAALRWFSVDLDADDHTRVGR